VEMMKISFGTDFERLLFQKIALGIPASISCLAVTVLGEGIFCRRTIAYAGTLPDFFHPATV